MSSFLLTEMKTVATIDFGFGSFGYLFVIINHFSLYFISGVLVMVNFIVCF